MLLAAGGSYLHMIAEELLAIPAAARSRLRLFTATPHDQLPDGLAALAMAYDLRLEALAGRSGTLRVEVLSRLTDKETLAEA